MSKHIDRRARELLGDIIGYDLRRTLDTDSMTVTVDDALTAISEALTAGASGGGDAFARWLSEEVCIARNEWVRLHERDWLEDHGERVHPDDFIGKWLADRMPLRRATPASPAAVNREYCPCMKEDCPKCYSIKPATPQPAAAQSKLVMVPRDELLSFKAWFNTDTALARHFRAKVDNLIAAAPQPQQCKHKWRDSDRADPMLPCAWVQQCAKCGAYEDDN